ncbi:unnamed protein product [Ascophyllum nodosum]
MVGLTCGTKEGLAMWCNMDPCGLVCAVITYSLILFAQFSVTSCVLGSWMGGSFFGVVNVVLFNLLACLAHTSHARAMLTDPGAVSSSALPPASEVEAAGGSNGASIPVNPRRFCRKCNAYKPVRAHHCSICRRCVVKMDHHCPWVNNCVGIGNHKFFIQFISYVFALSVYSLVLVVSRLMACAKKPSMCEAPTSMLVVLLVVEAVLFGMFTMCMMCDQWETVTTNQTQIDRLKGETHATSLEINEVFGGVRNGRRLRLDYFLPTRVAFPADIWEDVMGYRCRNPCGLAAAVAGRAPGGALAAHAGDDDADDAGDVEMGEFYSGPGTVRERRQPAIETQRLLGKESGGGTSSISGSPLNGLSSKSAVVSNGVGGDGVGGVVMAAGGINFREEHGVKRP